MVNTLAFIEIGFAAAVFVVLFFVSAPYGRHVRGGWGPVIGSRYAWMVMEFPAFFVIALTVIAHEGNAGPRGLFFLCLWEMHYAYRVFVYPFLLTTPEKPFPLLLVAFAVCFNTINGFINGSSLVSQGMHYAQQGLPCIVRIFCGVLLFFTGFYMHVHSDAVLRELRKNRDGEYRVPERGLFKLVASPNYLGEIMEWTGWAVATWSVAGLAFLLFTIANLLPRAASNHRWYRENFPGYPARRRAIVPFVW